MSPCCDSRFPNPRDTMQPICVPTNLLSKKDDRVVKVILRGVGASSLPPMDFFNALVENGIIQDNCYNNFKITMPENNRKRYVFGDVHFTHRQSFSIIFQGETINFLLINPKDSRLQITMLPMPVETTEEAVLFILKSINSKIDVSDIRLAPGSQMRHDRWQAMVSYECRNLLPDHFVLRDLGPENENLKVKLFIEGRKSPQNDDPVMTKSSSSHAQRQTPPAPPAPPTPYSSSNTTTLSTPPPPAPANHVPPSSCPPAPAAQPNAQPAATPVTRATPATPRPPLSGLADAEVKENHSRPSPSPNDEQQVKKRSKHDGHWLQSVWEKIDALDEKYPDPKLT